MLSYFSVAVSEMVVLSYSVIHYIYIPVTLGLCFHYWCSVYSICKCSDTLWHISRVRLFANYTISLLSLCRIIWRHWSTKMLVKCMLPSVCLRLRQFSKLSFNQYIGLRVFSLPNSPVLIVRMCTFILLSSSSSNRKYESLTIVYGYLMKQWYALYVLLCSCSSYLMYFV